MRSLRRRLVPVCVWSTWKLTLNESQPAAPLSPVCAYEPQRIN